MTPLVDVVMVILIFLMLAGTFAGAEHYLVSNLPFTEKGQGATAPPQTGIPDEPLDIRVDSPVPDRFVAQAGQIRVSDPTSLTLQLRKMHEEYKRAGTTTDKIQVVVSPARNVKYRFLIEVYQAALDAEFTKVSFATSH